MQLSVQVIFARRLSDPIREDPWLTFSSARLPNAETIAALEEGDRIANDPTRKRRTVDELFTGLKR